MSCTKILHFPGDRKNTLQFTETAAFIKKMRKIIPRVLPEEEKSEIADYYKSVEEWGRTAYPDMDYSWSDMCNNSIIFECPIVQPSMRHARECHDSFTDGYDFIVNFFYYDYIDRILLKKY